ncbi:hypothetical protein HGA92_00910 [Candidatus Gracilibacteria bacterium]|nr:hypothetical protein [Candidatus Gracilibacteria bacterium]NUJ98830.1 hypothetical protein [Candidatus Gracilibacteria bacterium]
MGLREKILFPIVFAGTMALGSGCADKPSNVLVKAQVGKVCRILEIPGNEAEEVKLGKYVYIAKTRTGEDLNEDGILQKNEPSANYMHPFYGRNHPNYKIYLNYKPQEDTIISTRLNGKKNVLTVIDSIETGETIRIIPSIENDRKNASVILQIEGEEGQIKIPISSDIARLYKKGDWVELANIRTYGDANNDQKENEGEKPCFLDDKKIINGPAKEGDIWAIIFNQYDNDNVNKITHIKNIKVAEVVEVNLPKQ